MDASQILRRARIDAGLTLRELAERARTSHSTLAAYEAGRTTPRVDTLDRILRAAGFASDIGLSRRPDGTSEAREAKGRELQEVLELAGHFPARHSSSLEFPRFPSRRSA